MAVGAETGAHSLNEAFDTTDSWKGTQRALLLAIALTPTMRLNRGASTSRKHLCPTVCRSGGKPCVREEVC